MKYSSSVYDWAMRLDQRCVWALRKIGVNPGEVRGQNGRLKGAVFDFVIITGEREAQKQAVQDFLEDEYGATNVTFYGDPKNRNHGYAQFDMSKRAREHETSNG